VSDEPVHLSRVDGTGEWSPKVVAELRERFEEAIKNADRIVFFAARIEGRQMVVTATCDTREPSVVPWFQMLGFMQAKLNGWMREMLD
jgi:hypothetical protein